MSFSSDPLKVEGLVEFQRALRTVEDGLQKELRVALNKAADIVVEAARPKIPRRSGRAAASVKAQSSQRAAKIIGGSKKVPYYGFIEFGGRVGRDKSVSRPFVKSGRYILPAFAQHRQEVLDQVADGIRELAGRAGLEVHDG